MIKRIWAEQAKTIPEIKKTILYIEFADGSFVANEMDHSLSKQKLAVEIGKFAAFITNEARKEQEK
jgi:hypothetical protein